MLTYSKKLYGFMRSRIIYDWLPGRRQQLRNFYSQFIKAGDLCFDVGAHVGNRSEAWQHLGANVIAFEPQQDLAQYLSKKFRRNPRVQVIRAALGSHNGWSQLFISDLTPTVCTVDAAWIEEVKRDPRFRGINWNRKETIPLRSLDAMIEEFGQPNFCKIDVEGFEAQVLQGLHLPLPVISFEYIPIAKERAVKCIERLSKLGHYEYNWSETETMQFRSRHWLDHNGIIKIIRSLAPQQRSGDIYARLLNEDQR